jgi:hypothetical protein
MDTDMRQLHDGEVITVAAQEWSISEGRWIPVNTQRLGSRYNADTMPLLRRRDKFA